MNHNYPESLPHEEQLRLFRSFPNKQARNTLIETNMGLVLSVATKYSYTNIEKDDLASMGTIGLIKAVDTFDCDKGIKFATYATRCIENEILMHLRHENNKKQHILYLEHTIKCDKEENSILLKDELEDKKVSNSIYLCEEIVCFLDILNNVSNEVYRKSVRNLIVFIYAIGGTTRTDIAKKIGVSRPCISHVCIAQNKLCKHVSKYSYKTENDYLHFYKEDDMICLEMQGYPTIKRPFETDSFNDIGDILMERLM